MDVLSNLSVEILKAGAFIIAVGIGVALAFAFGFKKGAWAVVGAAFAYTVENIGLGVYVLLHINDLRWSAGKDALVHAPSLGGTPVVGQYLQPLDSFMGDAANSINQLTAFRYALPTAQEFFALAGYALLVLVPATIIALAFSRVQQLRLQRELQRTIDDVAAIKQRLGIDTENT